MRLPGAYPLGSLGPATDCAFRFDARRSDLLVDDPTLDWLPDLGHTTAIFSRLSQAVTRDALGRSIAVADHVPRMAWFDWDEDGVADDFGLLLETGVYNRCLQSQALTVSPWSSTLGTLTDGALSMGEVQLSYALDNSAAAAQAVSQAWTAGPFATGGIKAVSLFVAKGTATSNVVRLLQTGGANRLLATITWTGQVPAVATATGTYIGRERWATLPDGTVIWRLLFNTSSVTAGANHTLMLYPATTSGLATANTGDCYFGGVQVEDSPEPTSYIKTTTTAQDRAVDSLRWEWIRPPTAMQVYADLTVLAAADTLPIPLLRFGSTGARFSLLLDNNFTVEHHNGTSSVTSAAAGTVDWHDALHVRALLLGNGSVQAGWSINGSGEVPGSVSAALAPAAAWSATQMDVGYNLTGAMLLRTIKVVFDPVLSLATMEVLP